MRHDQQIKRYRGQFGVGDGLKSFFNNGVHVLVFSLLGVIIFLAALLVTFNVASFIITAEATKGKIYGSTYKGEGKEASAYSQVVFLVADVEYRFDDSVGSGSPRYEEGEEVEVLYDPKHPENAKIKSVVSLFFLPGLLWIFAGVLLFFSNLARKLKMSDVDYWRKRSPETVQATVTEVVKDEDKNPPIWEIYAEWTDPQTRKEYCFISNDLPRDPTEFLRFNKVSVLINSKNPKQYEMDTSFLPE